MFRFARLTPFLAVLALAVSATNTQASPVFTMSTFASSGPNDASPSWNTYVANALAGIDAGGATTGTAGQPTRYESGTIFTAGDFIVSDFNSWKGVGSPSAPFAGEFGNRVYFGLKVERDGDDQFSLDMLTNDMDSNDGNSFDNDGGFPSYTSYLVGINYGPDETRQTLSNLIAAGDDTVITSGLANQPIDLLLYVGVGNAFDASFLGLQDSLDYIGANLPFVVTNRYWMHQVDDESVLGEVTTTATVLGTTASPVPEPATLTLLGLGAAVAIVRRRRSSKQKPV